MAGRRRSARAHEQVLEAAIALFAERGLEATSMDAIAGRAGVSKATIYNHWADKDALCLEALAHVHGLDETPPEFASGDTRADLVAALTYRPAPDRREIQRAIMPHFIAHSARNAAFGHAWRARVMEPVRTRVTALLARATHDDELPAPLRLDAALPMLIGPMLYREIFGSVQPMPSDLAQQVVDAYWRACGATTPPPARRRKSGMSAARRR